MVSRDSTNESRQRILRAAEAEFAEKGFDGSRVDAIAARAGVNKALLYYYFKSKAGLLEALFDDFFLQLKEEKARIVRSDDPHREKDYWKAVIRQAMTVARNRLDLMRVVLLEELKGGRGHDRLVRRWRTEWESALGPETGDTPRPDQAVFNFFFEDLAMIVFLLLNEKWSAALDRSPQESEAQFFDLLRLQSEAYWMRPWEDSHGR